MIPLRFQRSMERLNAWAAAAAEQYEVEVPAYGGDGAAGNDADAEQGKEGIALLRQGLGKLF